MSLLDSSVNRSLLRSRYFLIACAAVLVSSVYWSAFALNAYNTYHEYSDLGIFAFDMFYHIHFASVVAGLQYLIFANHIAPDQLLVLPIFDLFQSSLTLLFVQAILVSLTGIAIFLVSRSIIRDERIALLLCLAFLINPGTFGLLVFDYHAEIMIPLFLILAFYFYFNRRLAPFIIFLLLLLGTIEVAPFIAIAFAVTMALYAVIRESDRAVRHEWLRYSAIAIAISLLALAAYSLITSSLLNAYASGQYANMPASLEVMNTFSQQFGSIGNGTGAPGLYDSFSFNPARTTEYLVFALLIIFLSFGVAGISDPIFAILFASPWLFEVFVVGNTSFLFPWYQYFGYALGGTAIMAMLSLRNIREGGIDRRFSLLDKWSATGHKIVLSIPAMIIILMLMWPYFIYSINLANFQQSFLFITNHTAEQQIQQLNSVISQIPGNASVMVPFFVMPHLINRRYLELIPSSQDGLTMIGTYGIMSAQEKYNISRYGAPQVMWFRPEYILADFNSEISMSAINGYQVQNFENLTGAINTPYGILFNGTYSVYNYSGLAILMKSRG
ncbi:MAG: DUF2079 domain-containing protein [Candidatus Marsarchaeota archaeon]|nr:DUF2079 domain-containing protein [Candidatus Marsarchaeota archaeon]MCL5413494.1 DUF2079 domain-containing protein [Candidatus Marsarchaeota archaeon]